AAVPIKSRQTREGSRRVDMFRTEDALPHSQRPVEEGLGFARAAGARGDSAEQMQIRRVPCILRRADPLARCDRPAKKAFGSCVIASRGSRRARGALWAGPGPERQTPRRRSDETPA